MSIKRNAVALVLVSTFGLPAAFGPATAYGPAAPASAVVAMGTAGDDGTAVKTPDPTPTPIPTTDGDTNWG